jgi:hypothetical protein
LHEVGGYVEPFTVHTADPTRAHEGDTGRRSQRQSGRHGSAATCATRNERPDVARATFLHAIRRSELLQFGIGKTDTYAAVKDADRCRDSALSPNCRFAFARHLQIERTWKTVRDYRCLEGHFHGFINAST